MTQLYLIRHGEAIGAVEHRIADLGPNTGLTPLGRRQAALLRDRLAATREIVPDVLIASTYPRAWETAQIIAPALGGLPIQPDPEVQELRTGEADGLPFAELDARYGRPDFLRDPFRPIAPGGESWAQFRLRISQALYRITHTHAGRSIVVVCHGGIVDNSFLFFFDLGSFRQPRGGFSTHNTSITEWAQREQRGESRWHLVRYNDALHLRDHVQWQGVSAEAATGADEPALPLPTEEEG